MNAHSLKALAGMLGAILLTMASPAFAAQSGMASFYWQGRLTANGERFNPGGMTAAHRTLPFGTMVRVVHVASGRSVVVRINDRGPFIKGRIIDLARGAAGRLGFVGAGVTRVRVEVVGRGAARLKGGQAKRQVTARRVAKPKRVAVAAPAAAFTNKLTTR
jgi:rare lipoprotein A